MAHTISLEEFQAHLKKSNLLSETQLSEVAQFIEESQQVGGEYGASDAARECIQRDLLTRWQARLLLAGKTSFFLGKYKLLEELGRGGMGAVYKAEQQPLGRIVALKLMSSKVLKDRTAVERFAREIQAAAALNHPNIVAAFDADQAGRTHFLVMEFVAGRDLSAILKQEQQLSVPLACEYIRQAALGLQHAHEQGMCHRDIKPGNLLIAGHGSEAPTVKVLDMGLARFTSETGSQGDLTTTGQIMGTPDYIAPEQARDTHSADIRSDIYSLGCSLFRAIVGEVPFDGDNFMAKLLARASGDPPRMRSKLPEVPQALDDIVAAMMALDPAHRFQQPVDVATALTPFAEGRVPEASVVPRSAGGSVPESDSTSDLNAPSVSEPRSDSVSRPDSEVDNFLSALANAPEDSTGSTFPSGHSSSHTEVETAPIATPATSDASEPNDALSKVRRRKQSAKKQMLFVGAGAILILAVIAGAIFWKASGTATVIVDWNLEDRDGGTLEVNGRTFPVGNSHQIVLERDPGQYELVLTRPGYEKFAVELHLTRGESEIVEPQWKPTTATLRTQQVAELTAEVDALHEQIRGELSPTSHTLTAEVDTLRDRLASWLTAHVDQEGSQVISQWMRSLPSPFDRMRQSEIDPHELRQATPEGSPLPAKELVGVLGSTRMKLNGRITGLVITPGNHSLLVASQHGGAALWNAETGELLQSVADPDHREMRGLCLQPNGRTVLLATNEHLQRYEFIDDQWQRLEPRQVLLGSDTNHVTYNSSGDRFLSIHLNQHRLRIWQSDPPEVLREVELPDEYFPSATFCDGDRRIIAANHHTVLYSWDVETGERTTLLNYQTAIGDVSASRDGEFVAVAGHIPSGVQAGPLRADTPLPHLEGAQGAGVSVDCSDDGSLIAAVDQDGGLCVWAAETRELRFRKQLTTYGLSHVALSDDGSRVAAGDYFGAAYILSSTDGSVICGPNAPPGHKTTLAVSADGQFVAAADTEQLRIYRLPEQTVYRQLRCHVGRIFDACFIPGGTFLAVCGTGGLIEIWNVESGGLIRTLIGSDWIRSVAASPDGQHIVSGGHNHLCHIWQVSDGRLQIELKGHEAQIHSVCYSPDGKTIASLDNNGALIQWDAGNGRQIRVTRNNHHQCVSFSPDGLRLITNPWFRQIDATNGREIRRSASLAGNLNCGFSADGRFLFAAPGERGTQFEIHGNDRRILRLNSKFEGYGKRVAIVEVQAAPDGRHMLALTWTGDVLVFRLRDWQPPE